jgi:hypothetical protein
MKNKDSFQSEAVFFIFKTLGHSTDRYRPRELIFDICAMLSYLCPYNLHHHFENPSVQKYPNFLY